MVWESTRVFPSLLGSGGCVDSRRLHDVRKAMFNGGGNGLGSRGDPKFCEDTFDMESYRPFGDAHNRGDFPIRFPILDPIQNGQLSQGQLFDTLVQGLRAGRGGAQ